MVLCDDVFSIATFAPACGSVFYLSHLSPLPSSQPLLPVFGAHGRARRGAAATLAVSMDVDDEEEMGVEAIYMAPLAPLCAEVLYSILEAKKM